MAKINAPEFVYTKYGKNPAAFTKHFTNLWFDSDGKVQDLYPKQLLFLNGQNFPNLVVVTKSRQIGFSSSAVGKVIQNAYFGMRPEFMIMSRTKVQAGKILKRIRSAFNSMPDYMRPEFKKETETQLILPNDCVIYSLPAKPESARGFTGDVYLDEFGTFGANEGIEIWAAVAPSITKGYNITMIGTPQGKGNLFHDFSTKTLSEISKSETTNDSYRMTVHWSEVPHVAAKIEKIRSIMPPMQFQQEMDLVFLDETDELFFTEQFIKDSLFDENLDPDKMLDLKVWNKDTGFVYQEDAVPEGAKFHFLKENYDYVFMGWDIASQVDSSVITVFGRRKGEETIEVIGLYKFMDVDYTVQTKMVSIIAQMCFAKVVGYDNTGLGGAVRHLLDQTKIKSILHPVNFNRQWKIESYQNLRTMMYNKKIICPDHDDVMKEFTHIEHDLVNNKIGAMRGWHDDIPSSFLIAIDTQRNQRQIARIGFLF